MVCREATGVWGELDVHKKDLVMDEEHVHWVGIADPLK